MDPCGAVMDWGRRPYTTTVRPFAGSNETALIAWRPAAPGAVAYPHLHCFQSRDWCDDFFQLEGPGEVPFTSRGYNARRAIPGLLGTSPCGPPEWFRTGMPYVPDGPPVVRDANGLPTCCNGPAVVIGAVLGGQSGVAYTPPPPPPELCPTLTETCAAAPAGAIGQLCTPSTFPIGQELWRKWSPGSGQDVEWFMSGNEFDTFEWWLYEGSNCGELVEIDSGIMTGVAVTIPFTTGAENVYAKWIRTSGVTGIVSVRLDVL